jgi:hypothetical protein
MNWGAGPALGLLTVSGYLLFLAGAALVWHKRGELSVWVQDEISAFRRNFSRYTPAGPFYAIREESRFKAIPACFFHSLGRLPRSCINGGGPILLLIGLLLFVLDFFV